MSPTNHNTLPNSDEILTLQQTLLESGVAKEKLLMLWDFSFNPLPDDKF